MLKLKHLLVTDITMRDGLLREMSVKESWTDALKEQIILSALELGRKYDFEEPHALHVAKVSQILFHALQREHALEPRFELILTLASLLHEIGLFISNRSHHKHSMYLIMHSDLFGLGKKDLLLVALIARYHRRATPKPTHEGYTTLGRQNRIVVSKLSSILRVADALDHSHSQRIHTVDCALENEHLALTVPRVKDLTLERLALREKGAMFEEVYGMEIILRKSSYTNLRGGAL